ncbi:hypothetical protein ACFQRL_03940 [Microbacterium fluvii]|uniref:Major facilitator superfamily (MFS) profile domain-containing protein n=1 Tax=Microbacterium fluvii TaxID=415215 RepID=A0ABW2H9Y2_9MICO|nr:hypothetical protein [Microbacterium fluvii]MCU4671744.1 hypothetical protein [Microbacterium fluvii]
MAAPQLAPRPMFAGVVAVWVVAALIGVAIGVFVPEGLRAAWLAIGLGVSLLLSFAIQLAAGRSQGFIRRVAMSVLGALLAMGVISLTFGLAALFPG